MSDERATRLAAIRGRAAAATPGPWRWRGIISKYGGGNVYLQALIRMRPIVMTFWRWGMQDARPVFRNAKSDRLVKGEFVIPQAHHPWEIGGIDHPDARFIEHSREDVEWLLGELDRTRTALAGLLGGVTTEQAAGCREVIHTERAWQEGVAAMLGRPRESEVTIEGGVGE